MDRNTWRYPLDALQLTMRTYNALRRLEHGIAWPNVRSGMYGVMHPSQDRSPDPTVWGERDLLRIRGFGKRGLADLQHAKRAYDAAQAAKMDPVEYWEWIDWYPDGTGDLSYILERNGQPSPGWRDSYVINDLPSAQFWVREKAFRGMEHASG